ncbi:MAG: KEOPS complex subunit Pcc1 [Nitrososphaerota archaeon]|nr:KEOPS complex subunit Pcc1 [Candidatus Calditenuis fumarioli]
MRSSSTAEMRVRFCDEVEAEGALRSLAPDNEPLPKGLSISMARDGVELVVKVGCERGVDSLLATLDELLMSLNLAERALCSRVKGSGSSV